MCPSPRILLLHWLIMLLWMLGFKDACASIHFGQPAIFRAVHYTPRMEVALERVEQVLHDVEVGRLTGYMHAKAGSLVVVCVYCTHPAGLQEVQHLRAQVCFADDMLAAESYPVLDSSRSSVTMLQAC